MNKNVLVLTCTVSPQTLISVKRNNVQIRESDYINAIEFYITNLHPNFDIIVVENSNSVRLLEKSIADGSRLKFIQAPIDISSSIQGKSAGELGMLQFLVNEGHLNDYQYIWKVTGRIVVRNINSLMRQFQGDICAYRYRDSHTCDTKFFGMNSELFREFANSNVNFDENLSNNLNIFSNSFHSIENYLALFCVRMSERKIKFFVPNQIPFYQGYSASTGKKLNTLKFYLFFFYSKLFRKIINKSLGSHLP